MSGPQVNLNAPSDEELAHVERIRSLAGSLNRLTLGVLILIVAQVAILAGPFAFVANGFALVVIFGAVRKTLTALGVEQQSRIMCYILLLIPLVNVITLAVIVFKSNSAMLNAGLRVGLFGVERHELDRFVNERSRWDAP